MPQYCVQEVAAKSEAEFVNLDTAIREGGERQTLITDTLSDAKKIVIANQADIVRMSEEVVKLSEDLSKVSNHTLAECTPDDVDHAKATPQGNVLAGTYVRHACNEGWFETDAGSADGTVSVFERNLRSRNAIGSHACSTTTTTTMSYKAKKREREKRKETL
jgi:hypothetical protein